MWFNIIKDKAEDDRLRALGYDVPEKVSTSLTRDKIIDQIKEWANNRPEISPFDANFEVVRTQSYTVNVAAKNKTTLVVEPTTDRTDYFKESTHDREWNEELQRYIQVKRRDDTMLGRFFVAVYEIGSNRPMEGMIVSEEEDVSEFLLALESLHLPKIRAGGFYAGIESTILDKYNATITPDGILRVTGASGTNYMVSFPRDCKVTAIRKEITFQHYPELNTRVNVSMCVHIDTSLPLGDRYANVAMGLSNDTSSSVPDIMQLFGKDWNVTKPDRKEYYESKLKVSNKHITEGTASEILAQLNMGHPFDIPW